MNLHLTWLCGNLATESDFDNRTHLYTHTHTDPLGLAPCSWNMANADAKYDKLVLGEGAKDGPDMPEYVDQADDDFGDGFERYTRDAVDLANRDLDKGIRETIRSHDNATIRLETATGKMVIIQNGKIDNYFRPDNPLGYMGNESDR